MPLLQEHQKLTSLLNLLDEGWWEWNIKTGESYHSPSWLRMLGLTEQDVCSHNDVWKDFIYPEDQAHTLYHQQELIDSGLDRWSLTYRMITKTEKIKWVQSRAQVVKRNTKGKAEIVAGVHLDITSHVEKARLEQHLAHQESLLQAVFEVSYGSINIFDFVKHRLVYSQGRILPQLGYTRKELFHFSKNFFADIIHQDDKKILQRHIDRILKKSRSGVRECIFRLRAKTGKFRWIMFRDVVLRDIPQHDKIEVIGSALDITSYKDLKKKLEDNVKILETFNHWNAHELRAPVASIMGLVDLLKVEAPTKESCQEIIGYMEKSLLAMDKIVRQFNKELYRASKRTRK